MYASQWFERCHFSEMADSTFIGYILRWGSYEMVISCLDDIAENEAEIANLSEDDEDYAEDKEYSIRGLPRHLTWQGLALPILA